MWDEISIASVSESAAELLNILELEQAEQLQG
jgi:hypothetical protein